MTAADPVRSLWENGQQQIRRGRLVAAVIRGSAGGIAGADDFLTFP